MKVVVLEPYSASALAQLKAQPEIEVLNADQIHDADVALIRSQTRIDADFLKKAPRLKLVVSATSGFDHMDWQTCQKRDVICAFAPEANAQSTAELTMTLMLAFERELLAVHKNVKNNQWRDGLKRPQGLAGQALGIIGLGRVGSRVAKMAKTFGMRLLGHDPYVDETIFKDLNIERLGLTELLRAADIVTLHVPLTKETKHMLNQPTFNEMQSEALLINTCRGPVVDENDLMVALDEGTIRGAAMDVIEREPPPKGHRLLTHPRLLLTPHIGAYTTSAWERSSQAAVEQVLRFQRGESVEVTLPLKDSWARF